MTIKGPLAGKNAVIFAATGAIGSAVARQLTAHGARAHVSARHAEAIGALAREIGATPAVVDATNEAEIDRWFDRIFNDAGTIDVVVNAIGPRASEAHYAVPATAIPYDRFLLPITLIAGSQFLTSRAAARYMTTQGHGAIVTLSASLSGLFIPFMPGITAACGAVEALTRTMAAELAQTGVRVNCVRAGSMPETRTIQETSARMASTLGMDVDEFRRGSVMANIRRLPLTVGELAATVAWVASAAASGVHGQVINVCGGAIVSR